MANPIENKQIADALNEYNQEVENGTFPMDEHSFHMPDVEWEQFLDLTKKPE